MYFLRKIFLHSPGHYLAALIVAIAMGIFRFVTLPGWISTRFVWYEIFSVSGFMTFMIGALLTVAYFGAFDLFGYVFSPGRIGKQRKYKDYADYSQKKAEKRANSGYFFVPYYVVGVLVMLVSNVFA